MAAETIRYDVRPLIAAVAGIIALEFAASRIIGVDPLIVTGVLRCIDAILVIGISIRFADGVGIPGLLPPDFTRGFKRGALWSLVFAAAAGIGAIGLFLSGTDPFGVIRVPLPSETHQVVLFFLIGGVIGPIAEELVFRGVVFGFFRRWGFWAALTLSTALFGLAHGIGGFGAPQLIGGLVFAVAYEYEKNILAPIVIHVTGNLALFSLGLL